MTRQELIDLLDKSDRAVERAILILFESQIADEQQEHATKYHNNRGFCSNDAELFTSFANRIKGGQTLTPSQLECCRRLSPTGRHRLGKYFRQLSEAGTARLTSLCVHADGSPASDLARIPEMPGEWGVKEA